MLSLYISSYQAYSNWFPQFHKFCLAFQLVLQLFWIATLPFHSYPSQSHCLNLCIFKWYPQNARDMCSHYITCAWLSMKDWTFLTKLPGYLIIISLTTHFESYLTSPGLVQLLFQNPKSTFFSFSHKSAE